MRHLSWLCVALMAAGCVVPTGSKDAGTGATGTGRPGAVTPAATQPSKAPVSALTRAQARQKGIVDAIQSTLVAGDLARSQNTLQLISDNGLGLISDNGLGLISDNGLGYRVAQAPEVYYENVGEQGSLTWVSTFYKPDYRGEIRAYPTAAYKAQGKAATAVEHYTWDALGIDIKNPTFPLKFPLDAALTYKINPLKSARFTFIKRMNLVFDMNIQQVEPPPARVIHNGFAASYDMEVPLADGTKEVISMQAYDMVYAPGEGPGKGVFYAPTTFKAKGENGRGQLEMAVTRHGSAGTGEVLTMTLEATHTAAAGGRQSRLKLDISEENRQKSVVTDVENAVEAVLDIAPDRTGTGEVRASGSAEVLGTITWKPDGLGSITFTDGTVEKVRVF